MDLYTENLILIQNILIPKNNQPFLNYLHKTEESYLTFQIPYYSQFYSLLILKISTLSETY